jgi:NADH:ubiquinone oxidoreductase subunit F (NADH-binding)
VDVAADFDSVSDAGSTLGSGALIVMDDSTCMVDVARNCLGFMVHESCGKCSPCRIGTQLLLEMVTDVCEGRGRNGVLDEMVGLANHVQKASLCGLGQSAPAALLSTLEHFRPEYENHLGNGDCEVCRG